MQEGLSVEDLEKISQNFDQTQLINLNDFLPENLASDQAGILIIRNGVNQILKKKGYTADHLLDEQEKL